jgi:hypothetical protein
VSLARTSFARDRRAAATFVVAALCGLWAPLVEAQTAACVRVSREPRPSNVRWNAPLDKVISLQQGETALRTLLDRVAAEGKFRVAYATEFVATARPMCLTAESALVGDVLTELLRETQLEPVAVGGDQVVLRPRIARAPDSMATRLASVATKLDPVVSEMRRLDGDPRLAYSVNSVSGSRLSARSTSTAAQTYDGLIPGVWVWEQSPSNPVTHFGSIRGASSFGLSYPKIYIDGIEVADPLLLNGIAGDAIQRVDVIRGPQGAALFGAGAISGVVNIITRQDGAALNSGQRFGLQARSSAGLSSSDYTTSDVVSQDHGLSFRSGLGTNTGGGSVSFRRIGDFVQGAASSQVAANASMRRIGAQSVFSTTLRWFSQDAGSPANPLLARAVRDYDSTHVRVTPQGDTIRPLRPDTIALPQSVRQYTLGATGSYQSSGRWMYSGTAGVDGYRLAGVASAGVVPSSVDSALRAARGSADRITLRAVSSAQFGDPAGRAESLTFSFEQSTLRQRTATNATRPGYARLMTGESPAVWRSNTGLSAQSTVSFNGTFFVNAGTRLERIAGYAGGTSFEFLPALGAAYLRDVGGTTVKFRSAYGKAVRPVETAPLSHPANPFGMWKPDDLEPERQSGIEAGIDLWRGPFTARVTHFRQTASGLVQSMTVRTQTQGGTGGGGGGGGPGAGGPGWRLDQIVENVGSISNVGWELDGRAELGALSLGGTLSLVDSRVVRTLDGYVGDLKAGDRMLEVPARTASLSAGWTAPKWGTTWTVSRASDWMGYDRVQIARATAAAQAGAGAVPAAESLRDYWLHYDGVTRLRGMFSRDISNRFSLHVVGDNLFDVQRGEPDNATITPGRTLTFGVKAKR